MATNITLLIWCSNTLLLSASAQRWQDLSITAVINILISFFVLNFACESRRKKMINWVSAMLFLAVNIFFFHFHKHYNKKAKNSIVYLHLHHAWCWWLQFTIHYSVFTKHMKKIIFFPSTHSQIKSAFFSFLFHSQLCMLFWKFLTLLRWNLIK